MNRILFLLSLVALVLSACAPSTDAATVETSSRCITPTKFSMTDVDVSSEVSKLNANTSPEIGQLEYVLSKIHPGFTCGTLFQRSANRSLRSIRVYRVTTSTEFFETKKAQLRTLLKNFDIPATSRLVVYADFNDGLPRALVKTGWSEKLATSDAGYKALTFHSKESGAPYLKLASSQQSFFVSDMSTSTSSRTDVYNCADFTSQAAAQAFFSSSSDDENRLDADNDGIACEAQANTSSTYRVAVASTRTISPTYVSPSYSSGRCYVSGYTRSNGTRVRGYYRSC